LDTLNTNPLFRISPITINSTSSISTLVVTAPKIGKSLSPLIAMIVIIAGCSWDERPVRNTAGNSASSGNATGGQANGNLTSASSTPSDVRNPDIPAGTPTFRFGNFDYVLVSSSNVVNQYIPFGQTLDDWTSMFALRKFPNMASPDEAVNNVTQTLKLEHPQTKFKVTRDEATGDRGVDFVIWTADKQLSEFDVHIYQQRDGGVLGKMFLMRGYGEEGHFNLLKKVADEKDGLTKAVFGFSFPTFLPPK